MEQLKVQELKRFMEVKTKMKHSNLFRSKRAAELNQLYSFVLLIVLVGMVIGVGIITNDKIGSTTSYKRLNYNNSLTPTGNLTLTALDFGNLTKVVKVYNDTATDNTLPSTCYTINTTPGQFQVKVTDNSTCLWDFDNGRAIYVIFDYKDFATATRTAANSVVTEIANIATDWIGLIVTIMILAIVLFLVVSSFKTDNFRG